MEFLMEYLAKGFVIMLMISLPCVLVAAGIGLVVGILQAVTQVQEQTIAAAPKILLVFLTIIVLGSWYVKILHDFFIEGGNLAFEIVPKSESYVLPDNYFKYTHPFQGEMYDTITKNSNIKEIMQHPGKIPWADKQNIDKYTPARGDIPTPNFIERKRILGR